MGRQLGASLRCRSAVMFEEFQGVRKFGKELNLKRYLKGNGNIILSVFGGSCSSNSIEPNSDIVANISKASAVPGIPKQGGRQFLSCF